MDSFLAEGPGVLLAPLQASCAIVLDVCGGCILGETWSGKALASLVSGVSLVESKGVLGPGSAGSVHAQRLLRFC